MTRPPLIRLSSRLSGLPLCPHLLRHQNRRRPRYVALFLLLCVSLTSDLPADRIKELEEEVAKLKGTYSDDHCSFRCRLFACLAQVNASSIANPSERDTAPLVVRADVKDVKSAPAPSSGRFLLYIVLSQLH